MKLICFFGFIILDLRKIKLEVFKENKSAIKCYQKVGFRKVGVLKEETFHLGKYKDLVIMELLSKEFLRKNRDFIEKIKELNLS